MSQSRLEWARKRLAGKIRASTLLALFISAVVVMGGAKLAQAQTGGQLEAAKEKAIQIIGERGPQLIDNIETRYGDIQAGRLLWLALVLVILLPLVGFVGSLLYPKMKAKTIQQRIPGVPPGRLNQLYLIQAMVIGVVLLALGFFLLLIQLWTGVLGAVTNPQIALQTQAINYIVDNRRDLVENYAEIFVNIAQDLGNDPEEVILTTIIDNDQKVRSDPLLNFTARAINFSWPLFSNFYLIAFLAVLIFFLRRTWPDIKNMLRYPIEVIAAEREGRPVPVFEAPRSIRKGPQRTPYSAQLPYNSYSPGPPAPYNQPQGQQPYNPGPYQQQPKPPVYGGPQGPSYQGLPPAQPGYGFPAQQVPNYNYRPTQAPFGLPPQGNQAATTVMWSYARRIIVTEAKVLLSFGVLAFILALVMGEFLSVFFGTVIGLLIELTSVAMIYFIRLDGSSFIITISSLLVLFFLAECILLFIAAFIFLIGKLLDALRFVFTGRLTWQQSGHLIWRNFVRFAWVIFVAAILGAGLSWLATNVVTFLISSSDPNWFLCLVSAPLILLVGLNLGMWLLRGFKTLRKLIRNTESFEVLAAAAGNY